MKNVLYILLGFIAGVLSCVIAFDWKEPKKTLSLPSRAPGSNEILRAPLSAANEIEVIISDVVIPANAQVPSHYHPGEEFVYVIEGQAVHVEDGLAEHIVKAGEGLVIQTGKIHAPRTEILPARAVVFRVHKKGEPEKILSKFK